MVQVRAQAPTRVDLAGGTLDLWPIHQLLDRKATVNIGITLPATVEISPSPDRDYHLISQDQDRACRGGFAAACANEQLPLLGLLLKALWSADLPPIKIVTTAKSPAGAGLGGSSCLAIAVAAALAAAQGKDLGEEALVSLVQDVEARLIRAPTGVQDYWGGVRGQINILGFPPGRVAVETLPLSQLGGLADEMIVCYSGRSRASAINNWEIFKRLFDGDAPLLAMFQDLGAVAEQCAEAVRDGDLSRALAHSQAEWTLRRQLWPAIETVDTKRLDEAARAAGARFSRVCGAGGGGVMVVFAPASARFRVETALSAAGGMVLSCTVAPVGLTVEVSGKI